jgi:hypothetical protein
MLAQWTSERGGEYTCYGRAYAYSYRTGGEKLAHSDEHTDSQ